MAKVLCTVYFTSLLPETLVTSGVRTFTSPGREGNGPLRGVGLIKDLPQ